MEKSILTVDNIFRDYPDIVRPEDLQPMLGIGRTLAFRLVRTGKINSIRYGKLYLIPKQYVIDYLNSNNEIKI